MASENQRESAFPNSGSSVAHPKLAELRKQSDVASLLDKLVSAGNAPNSSTNFVNRGIDLPNSSLLRKVSDITATNVNDAASIFQILPDTELGMQILVSSILSPEDMMETNLIYTSGLETKDAELSASLLKEIETYFDQVYKIRPLLNKWLKDALFLVGCYPMVILPENVIDAAINSTDNVSMETFRTAFDVHGKLPNIGLLGNSGPPVDQSGMNGVISYESFNELVSPLTFNAEVKVSLESYNDLFKNDRLVENSGVKENVKKQYKEIQSKLSLESTFLSVTDNPNVLKMPLVQETIRAERVQRAYSKMRVSTESRVTRKGDISVNELERALYKHRRYKNVPVLPLMPVTDPDRPSRGHPLVMKIPSESMIPVHVPGDPTQHMGYFIMVDANGNPLTRATQTDYYTDLTTNLNANQEMVSQLIATTKRAEFGRDTNREIDQDEIARVYGDLIEKDLISRLKNGLEGQHVEIAHMPEFYQVMLSRALAKMHTQLLYVPAQFVTYIAFDYNKYGVGMSLLQKNKIVAGLRSMIMFANTMAAIKNSIQRVVLNIQLDQDDPNPANTVEFLIHEYAKTRQASYPLGASNPLDIVSFLQNAGVEVAVSGNTRYPETKLSIDDKQSQHGKPDTELEDSLRKRFLQGIGVTPEMVDAASGAEFAATVVRNNLIMAKRVKDYQNTLMEFTIEFIQKYVINSSILLETLIDVIESNKSKIPAEFHHEPTDDDGDKYKDGDTAAQRYLTAFLKSLETSLPAPNVAEQATQYEAYQKFSDFIEKAVEAYIDPAAMDQTIVGDYSSAIPAIQKMVINYQKRQWLRNEGVMPELDDLVTNDDDNMPRLDFSKAEVMHNESLMKSIGEMLKKLTVYTKNHPMPTDTPPDDAGGDGQGGDGGQGGDNGQDGGDGSGGGDDFGLNDTGVDENGNPSNPEGTGEPGAETTDQTPSSSDTGSGEPEGASDTGEPTETGEVAPGEEGAGTGEGSEAPAAEKAPGEEGAIDETPPEGGAPEEKPVPEEKPGKEGGEEEPESEEGKEASSQSKVASGETEEETPSGSKKSSGETSEEEEES